MSYDKITKLRDSQTYKCDHKLTQETLSKRENFRNFNKALWSFQEAGIPISSEGREEKAQIISSRTKGSFHSQASHKLNFSSKATCKLYWRVIEQHCYTGPKVISKKKRAWLREIAREKSRWFIVLIGWPVVRFHKCTGCWF